MVLFIIKIGSLCSNSSWNLHFELHLLDILSNIKLKTSLSSFASTKSSLFVFVGYKASPKISFWVK